MPFRERRNEAVARDAKNLVDLAAVPRVLDAPAKGEDVQHPLLDP